MSDDPDTPYDPNVPQLAGKRICNGGGTLARLMQADATKRQQRARQLSEHGDHHGAEREGHDAAYLERHADRFRDSMEVIGSPLSAGVGGEVASAEPAKPTAHQNEVQQSPDMLAAEATSCRLTLTGAISDVALTLGLEAAESIGARTALERNLAHQMAAAHTVAMAILAKAHSFAVMTIPWIPDGQKQMQSIESARLATAAARLMDASQRAALTIERLRNAGRQVVTVQHVTVQDGGQAVVAGTVDRGVGRK